MTRFLLSLLVLIMFLLGSCAPAAPTVPPTAPVPTQIVDKPTAAAAQPTLEATAGPGTMNRITIPASALANNMIGEPTQRIIQVYLPPSYNASEKRYPVIYYLPGYSDNAILGFRLPGDMDALIKDGAVREMIVVVVGGDNKLGGSFYVNSPVTGNWEDYVVDDVVGYVDANFRTLAQAESRGITGHSMGGFGALNIAMHRPDVFSAVYSLSPGLFDENGLAESFMFADEGLVKRFIEYESDLAALPLEEAQKKMLPAPERFTLAYGYAFAPNPDRHPPYFDYPYGEVDGQLVRAEEVWKRWEAGFGGIAEEALEYKDNLLQLKGIVVEYGIHDENPFIPPGSEYYAEQLTAAGIPVRVEGYNGNHSSQLRERIGKYMLPFFSEILTFD